MTINKYYLILLSSIFLTGCGATLKEFQKMSPNERASKTCSNDYLVKHYKDKELSYYREIENLETLLMNGYKTISNCSTIVIDDRNTYLYTGILENTTQHTPKTPKKRVIRKCRQNVVPLTSYAMDKYLARKDDLAPLLEDVRTRKQNAYESCFNKVVDFSAEKAFGYYKN